MLALWRWSGFHHRQPRHANRTRCFPRLGLLHGVMRLGASFTNSGLRPLGPLTGLGIRRGFGYGISHTQTHFAPIRDPRLDMFSTPLFQSLSNLPPESQPPIPKRQGGGQSHGNHPPGSIMARGVFALLLISLPAFTHENKVMLSSPSPNPSP